MTGEQNDEVSKIMTPVNTFVEEERIKFITGDRDLSEWDDFVAEIRKLGDVDKCWTTTTAANSSRWANGAIPRCPPTCAEQRGSWN